MPIASQLFSWAEGKIGEIVAIGGFGAFPLQGFDPLGIRGGDVAPDYLDLMKQYEEKLVGATRTDGSNQRQVASTVCIFCI